MQDATSKEEMRIPYIIERKSKSTINTSNSKINYKLADDRNPENEPPKTQERQKGKLYLNPNHTHFIMVDNGTTGKTKVESELRLRLECALDKKWENEEGMNCSFIVLANPKNSQEKAPQNTAQEKFCKTSPITSHFKSHFQIIYYSTSYQCRWNRRDVVWSSGGRRPRRAVTGLPKHQAGHSDGCGEQFGQNGGRNRVHLHELWTGRGWTRCYHEKKNACIIFYCLLFLCRSLHSHAITTLGLVHNPHSASTRK